MLRTPYPIPEISQHLRRYIIEEIHEVILLWAAESTSDLSRNRYLKTRKSRCELVDVDGVITEMELHIVGCQIISIV